MFMGVTFLDEKGHKYIEPINVTHIIRVSFLDVKNPDAGVNFHMRNGDVLPSTDTMDVVAPLMDQTWKEAATIVLTQVYIEMAEQNKPKRRKK
jgi:hypothetical protein